MAVQAMNLNPLDRQTKNQQLMPLVLIPTYNERDNLIPLIDAVQSNLPSSHVLIIDDNSPDGTGELAAARARDDPLVNVMHRQTKQGLGRAYLAGFRWALERDYSHIFEMDADFSHDPQDLPRLLMATRTTDIALGCRWMPVPEYHQATVVPKTSAPSGWIKLPERRVSSQSGRVRHPASRKPAARRTR